MEEVKDLENAQLTDDEKKLLEDKQAMEVVKTLNENLRLSLRMSRFKSIRRAGRRGHLTPALELVPKKPFNNRANSSTRKGKHSRFIAEQIRDLYEGRRKAKERADREAA